jgi:hypothetical protein
LRVAGVRFQHERSFDVLATAKPSSLIAPGIWLGVDAVLRLESAEHPLLARRHPLGHVPLALGGGAPIFGVSHVLINVLINEHRPLTESTPLGAEMQFSAPLC